MSKLPTIQVVFLDHHAISQHDHGILTEFMVESTYIRGVILEYGGKKKTMIPESVAKEIGLAARDVVRNHTPGVDSVQDAFIARLANLIGEGAH